MEVPTVNSHALCFDHTYGGSYSYFARRMRLRSYSIGHARYKCATRVAGLGARSSRWIAWLEAMRDVVVDEG